MGLSNYLPSSRISQAGVIPNAAARPASPYEGQLVYELDTNRLLVWDGAVWVAPNSQTANPPGLELIKTQPIATSPAPSNFTVANCFSSDYDVFRITLDTTFSNNGVRVYMRPASITSGYTGNFVFMNSGSGVNGAGAGTGSAFDIGLSQAGQANAEIIMYNVGTSGRAKRMHSTLVTSFYFSTAWGLTTGTGASTDLYVEVQTGTMTGGEIRIYGMRK
jgi:hypothetical protein